MTFEEKRRAAFEEWFISVYPHFPGHIVESWLVYGEGDSYVDADTQDMWSAWQAALKWQNKP